MAQRIVSIWFQHLLTDWKSRREPELRDLPFVLAMQERNRRVVKAVNSIAQSQGVYEDMVLADARAILPELKALEYEPQQSEKLLESLGEWCIRFTPQVSLDKPNGLFLDASGCAHLWGGEDKYVSDIFVRFSAFGYKVKVAMADTAGAAWALSRFGKSSCQILKPGMEVQAMADLPPQALRLDAPVLERLEKLGLNTIASFSSMPRTALRRRFGQTLLTRLDQAFGTEMELMEHLRPLAPYQERLPSFEPICTAEGIAIALQTLLEIICERLSRESRGLRQCRLSCFRVDGQVQYVEITTSAPSRNLTHLFKLFENRISQIEPGLGIELFVLEAAVVEELLASQDALWALAASSEKAIAELQDRLAGRVGEKELHCYIPQEQHWPESSISDNPSLVKEPTIPWRIDLPRPSHILFSPEAIEVTVPMPDYPPLLFVHKGQRHSVKKADGPERIEQEWWKREGLYRDYYCVEDERGERYWLFRSGSYTGNEEVKWYLHGFFA